MKWVATVLIGINCVCGLYLVVVLCTVSEQKKRQAWIVREGALFITLLSVLVWTSGNRLQNDWAGSTIMMLGLCMVFSMTFFVHYTYCTGESEFKELLKVFDMSYTLVLVCFKVVGPVFRPKWYITLLVSSILFTVSRTMNIYYSEDRNAIQMVATVIFSVFICVVGDSFAYTMRWALVRSFVF